MLFEQADLEQPFDTTQKTYDTLAEMFPNATTKTISEALSASHTYEEAVIQLSAKPEEKKKCKSSEEVISAYKERNLAKNDSSFYTIEITRDNLWRDAIRFYKVSVANKELLLKRPYLMNLLKDLLMSKSSILHSGPLIQNILCRIWKP